MQKRSNKLSLKRSEIDSKMLNKTMQTRAISYHL